MNAPLEESSAQKLCLRLLHAEDEDEVITALKDVGAWDTLDWWVPYGSISNNRGIVSNQQSSAVAALVEKIVNSIDAVLTAECIRRGIDPRGPTAPANMREAVEQFFEVREGSLANLDATSRTRLAEKVRLVASGRKSHPSYLIIDEGEGQCPSSFPETLVSVLRENKARIRFVQGKFNMGGTGVLQFAGDQSFQLIISRRQPDLLQEGQAPDSRWGFTLVRRLEPGQSRPHSSYVYLAPGGHVPAFEADSIDLLPGSYPETFALPFEAGTCIKLWHYKLPGRLKTLATLDLRYALDRYLPEPSLPIRIHERRPGYRAHYYDTTMSGLLSVLADNKDQIEPGLDTGALIQVPGVGKIGIRSVVLRESAGNRYKNGIFFVVNGQLHSERTGASIESRTRLGYIASTMLVFIDCSSLPPRVIEDVFLASRDRMRECAESERLEEAVFEWLRDHPGLRDLNARRRQERMKQALSPEETAGVFQSLLRSDPSLAFLFGRGKELKLPKGELPEKEEYVGREFPTFFRLAKEPKSGLVKKCPRNRTCRVEFETDATNEYFTRSKDRGRLEVKGLPELTGMHLWDGNATLRFAPPSTASEGDQLRIGVAVSDVAKVEPLSSSFVIEVEADAPPKKPGGPPKPPGAALSGLPRIIEIRRDEWHYYQFNEDSAVLLRHGGEEETIDMIINMDNIHLRNEIARRRKMDPELVRYWFKYGLCLLVLGMLFDERRRSEMVKEEGAEQVREEEDAFARISHTSKGLAVTIVPVIAQLSRGQRHGLLERSEELRDSLQQPSS